MFSISYNKGTNNIKISGEFDTSKKDEAKEILANLTDSVTIDLSELEFISSAGIGILVMAYQNLKKQNKNFTLINLKPHIKKVFEVSLLDTVFNIK